VTRKNHFEEFKDHTRLKHFLLGVYLKAWAMILMKYARKFPRVWFVDAFAGAGRDLQGQPGSPVIACEIAQEVNRELFPGGITNETGMRVIAIEREDEFYQLLKGHLQTWTDCRPRFTYLRDGELDEERLDKMLGFVEGDPTLFFLDPFGVDGLSADLLPKALSGAHNELLILFHDEGAGRHAGKAASDEGRAFDAIAEVLEHPSILGEEDDAARLAEAKEHAKRSEAGYKSKPSAIAILNRAFGSTKWRSELEKIPEDQWPARRARILELYLELLKDSGASYRLKFAIQTLEGRHKYWLIHASRNVSAFVAMKEAMHRTRKEREKQLGTDEAGSVSLFADSKVDRPAVQVDTDLLAVVAFARQHFAGQKVQWSGKGGVKEGVLRGTPIMPWECDALKTELDPFRVKSGVYEFPPIG
jgi:three-Cys-motif partner protein